jgi:acyl-CoA reductase-like NAD-dependent aldehyde dehydrogenase
MNSSKKIKVNSPYDNSLIKELNLLSEKEVFSILESAYKLHQKNSPLPPYERISILEKFVSLLEEKKTEIIHLSVREGGKPLVDSEVEINRAIEGVKLAIYSIGKLGGEEIPMNLNPASKNHIAFTQRHPCGVIVAISAFNHPINLIIHQVIPAVAIGAPVIVKPAETTPLTCFKLLDLLHQAGLKKTWAQAILCDTDIAEKLVTDPRVSYLSFIGSAKVGWYLRSKLSPGTRCTLEHGGSAPVILDTSADLTKALPALIKGGFYHAGQVCVSVQRVFIHKKIMASVCEKMISLSKRLKTGDPSKKTTDIGPLILEKELSRVDQWVQEAINEGAELLCGGKKISTSLYEPTLLKNPSLLSRVSTQEIFGPVICLYEYENIDNAINLANELPFSFQSAVFATDINLAFNTAKRLKGRCVLINNHTAFRVDWMPFGGSQQSGLGLGGIHHSMEDMCEEKLLVINIPGLHN